MANLKGTRTEVNLMKSFAGECQASTRYNYYAKEARKEGFVQIANIFAETADNEIQHAKRFFKFLNEDVKGEKVQITSDFPVGLGDTAFNLKAAAEGEYEEHSDLYPSFADIAEEEGFKEIAYVWREIAEVEERHEARFLKLLENVQNGKVFKKDEEVEWKCNNCGYIHKGESAPEVCPACAHPQGHFEVFKETY
ncbi:MAG: rubrerythrin family protein [Tissierellia bacterium]|jgi:rubrerythrin|nr:rubrerythrin family protein [Tissierellia bacterium]